MTESIHSILRTFREEATHNRYLGDKFERLVRNYLKTDPLYAELYSDVWLWSEWPDRNKRPDTGIDLVAKERVTGNYTAIQCKFFDPAHVLQKADIDSFFTASGKEPFKKRLIISTTDKWSKHAEDALSDQHIPVARLRIQDLDASPIDWSKFTPSKPESITLKPKKKLRKHQEEALAKVISGLKKASRGKLVMACGTGKTFTALKIAEEMVPDGGNVLFLVPSISLISQTLTEWASEADRKMNRFVVCSDPKAGKKKDEEDISTHDLAFPAHTNPRLLATQIKAIKETEKKHVTVIFSTYQSIEVVSEAQKLGAPDFDLVVCDEAHRTTGVERLEHDAKEASAFIRIHDEAFIRANKRLYMTATPRIYDDASKGKAKDADLELYSMDDPAVYGEELYRLDFSEAVRKGLLSDYKVIVLAVDEKFVNRAFQLQLADSNNELNLDDVVKIVGCYNGLKKKMVRVDGDGGDGIDPAPMRRAVAFSRSIKDSKKITDLFANIIREYEQKTDSESESGEEFLRCEVKHVDGKDNALVRNERLQWLKEDTSKDTVCRILSNARCLSEGVDVPALDAVMFLNPRNSVVDVVQSVGRVMRKVEGKQYGYIILPIGIPADVAPEVALADNQKYKIVWQVLQALRAHDDRFNAVINQLDINKKRPDQIQIIGVGGEAKEGSNGNDPVAIQTTFNFPHLEDWQNAIFAKIVVKCGSRRYWESWAQDVAKIAERHITRIKALLESSGDGYRQKFETFLNGLRKNLNPSITEADAIEMLAQHLITKPVFDALFENYEFTTHNPISKTMQKMLDLLEKQSLEKETASLEKFYESVRERARGIDNAEGKQRIIVELYDKFFKAAFPRMAERLGIVYTPIEVVDFINRSADDILRKEFGVSLTDKDVHILDPFTGTGTFIVRLIQSGIIKDADLVRKFRSELHANELILLAYYIAAINIEEAFHGRTSGTYEPFQGIVLTDTFQLNEGKGAREEQMFPDNNKRAREQQAVEIRVIVGNPPYSAGQDSANDNNRNLSYPNLDNRITQTFAARSNATLVRNLYDSYVRAIRWASDRVQDKGIVCFVTNGSFIDANNMDGLRKTLTAEFRRVYVFNLRGNQRTSGEQSRMEGGKIFGSGSRATVAITFLVKDSAKPGDGTISYYDIGDYLSRDEKLKGIRDWGSLENIPWRNITPNGHGDWINLRDPAFAEFMASGDKDNGKGLRLFEIYSLGVSTNRDAWAYNFSSKRLADNMNRMIDFYNAQRATYAKAVKRATKEPPSVEDVIDTDAKKIAWTRSLKNDVRKQKAYTFTPDSIVIGMYRPFTKQRMYFSRAFNEMVLLMPKLFPESKSDNLVISVTGIGASKSFSALVTNCIPNLHLHDTGQCFPLHYYEKLSEDDLFAKADGYSSLRRDAITDAALAAFRETYADSAIAKEDLFYYVYGVLHSPEYKTRFEADLKKQLPRIPFANDFWAFSKAGRELAHLHLNYETVEPWPLQSTDELDLGDATHYRVQKMKWAQKRIDGKLTEEKTTLIYNSRITLNGVPPEALEYIVNGKPAIEWVMERYQVTTDKDSGIINDPNDWATEHKDPAYILNLVKRVVRVSVETVKIVRSLPPLNERTK